MYNIHRVPGINDNADQQYYYWPLANTKTLLISYAIYCICLL
jgi:hypothetical protein